jgi:poly(3-hydroxybutyrate) depolymerase
MPIKGARIMVHPIQKAHHFPEIGVPLFWPFGLELMQAGQKMFPFEGKNMRFLEEVIKTQIVKPRPEWATQNQVVYALNTFTLRDFSLHKQSGDIPVLILPPYAGHTSVIADFHAKQSLIEVLLSKGGGRVFAADWHSATPEMKDYNIDHY